MRSFSAVAGVLLAGVCLSLSASAPTFLPARLVVDLNSVPIALASAPTAACTQRDTAYFQATDANSMVDLWKSDGTSAGTGDGADTGGDKGGGAIQPYMLMMLVLVLLGREPIERSCRLLVLTMTRANGGIERRWVGRSLRR